MKKIVAFFLALNMAVVMLAGCGASQPPRQPKPPRPKPRLPPKLPPQPGPSRRN